MDIAFIIKYISTHGEPQHILMIVMVWLLFSIYSKAKRMYVRTSKLLQLTEQCPSISKENVSWLLDDSRNNKPPEKSLCVVCKGAKNDGKVL